MKHKILLLFFLTLSLDVISQKEYSMEDLAKLNIKFSQVSDGLSNPNRKTTLEDWRDYEITITDIDGIDYTLPKKYYLDKDVVASNHSISSPIMYWDHTKYYILVPSFYDKVDGKLKFFMELVTFENGNFSSENILAYSEYKSMAPFFGKKEGQTKTRNKDGKNIPGNSMPSIYFIASATSNSPSGAKKTYLTQSGIWETEDYEIDKIFFFKIKDCYELASQNYWFDASYFPFEISIDALKNENARIPNRYFPIYCENEDISFGYTKDPSSIDRIKFIKHKEVSGSHVEIIDMPLIQNQGLMSTCEPYTYATLYQHFLNKKYFKKNQNKLLPDSLQVSYFGMMLNFFNKTTTNASGFEHIKDSSFVAEILYKNLKGGRTPQNINLKSFKENSFIFGNCKNIDKMLYFLSDDSIPFLIDGINNPLNKREERTNKFIDFINETYETYKNKTLKPNELNNIQKRFAEVTTLEPTDFDFNKALKKENVSYFFKSIFFDDCNFKKIENDINIYYLDYKANTSFQSIDSVITTVKNALQIFNSPVAISGSKDHIGIGGYDKNLNFFKKDKYPNNESHVTIISGYKSVVDPNTGKYKEVFKIHNSYGHIWQKQNNNGWIDARNFIFHHPLMQNKNRVLSMCIFTDKKFIHPQNLSEYKIYSEILAQKCHTNGIQKAIEFYQNKPSDVNLNVIFSKIEENIAKKQWGKALEFLKLYEFLLPTELRLPFAPSYTLPFIYKINYLMGYLNSKLNNVNESRKHYKQALNALSHKDFNAENYAEFKLGDGYPPHPIERKIEFLYDELEFKLFDKHSDYKKPFYDEHKLTVAQNQKFYNIDFKKNLNELAGIINLMVTLLEKDSDIEYIDQLLDYEKIVKSEMNNPNSKIEQYNWEIIFKSYSKLYERLSAFDTKKNLDISLDYANKLINISKKKEEVILQKTKILYKSENYKGVIDFLDPIRKEYKYSSRYRLENHYVLLIKYYKGMSYFKLNDKLNASKELSPVIIGFNISNENPKEFSRIELNETLTQCPKSVLIEFDKNIKQFGIEKAIFSLKKESHLINYQIDDFLELTNLYRRDYEMKDNNLRIYKLITELFPKESIAFESYGLALSNGNQKKEAIEMFKKSLILKPDNKFVKEKLESLLKE